MRVGLMLAAAAALVTGAGQAGAQTFVRYGVSGVGTQSILTTGSPDISRSIVAFNATFEVLQSPSSYNDGTLRFSTNGSSYSFSGATYQPYGNASAATPGVLNYTDSSPMPYGGMGGSLSVNYDDPASATTFPTSVGSSFATGNFNFHIQDVRAAQSYIDFTGSIFRFDVLGTSSAFRTLSFTTSVATAPEPATWLFMVLGFGLLGFALRRGRPVSRHAFAA